MNEPLPFDTVVMESGDQTLRMSVQEFLDLPFSQRVQAILGGPPQFLCGEQYIDPARALKALRLREANSD